jgi:hypothetical protein
MRRAVAGHIWSCKALACFRVRAEAEDRPAGPRHHDGTVQPRGLATGQRHVRDECTILSHAWTGRSLQVRVMYVAALDILLLHTHWAAPCSDVEISIKLNCTTISRIPRPSQLVRNPSTRSRPSPIRLPAEDRPRFFWRFWNSAHATTTEWDETQSSNGDF